MHYTRQDDGGLLYGVPRVIYCQAVSLCIVQRILLSFVGLWVGSYCASDMVTVHPWEHEDSWNSSRSQ